jgi:hypothetical protein
MTVEKRAKRQAFDAIVLHLYTKEKLSTYQIAARLRCSQGRVGRSLRRTRTPRRTSHQGQIVRFSARRAAA